MTATVASSGVPQLAEALRQTARTHFGHDALVVGQPGVETGLELRVPSQQDQPSKARAARRIDERAPFPQLERGDVDLEITKGVRHLREDSGMPSAFQAGPSDPFRI